MVAFQKANSCCVVCSSESKAKTSQLEDSLSASSASLQLESGSLIFRRHEIISGLFGVAYLSLFMWLDQT